MNELEMTKAFAELEGIQLTFSGGKYYTKEDEFNGWIAMTEYNPLLPNTLNCAARDKYRVENDFDDGACFIYDKNGDLMTEVSFNGDISKAAIECILKSQGLWK